MKQYNGEKYIVSFTTFAARADDACKMIYNLLSKQTYKNFHLVCTLYKDDVHKMSDTFNLFVENNLFEVIIADENLCPHLKYYYAMLKYHDKPIITIDDDRIYSPNTIQKLVEKYESIKYKSIISCCAIKYTKQGNTISNRNSWPKNRLSANNTSFVAMAEGFAGVLYPPNCFDKLNSEVSNIKQCLYDDDLFLKTLEIRQKIPVTQIDGVYYDKQTNLGVWGTDIQHAQQFALATHGNMKGRYPIDYRQSVTDKFSNILLKGFEL